MPTRRSSSEQKEFGPYELELETQTTATRFSFMPSNSGSILFPPFTQYNSCAVRPTQPVLVATAAAIPNSKTIRHDPAETDKHVHIPVSRCEKKADTPIDQRHRHQPPNGDEHHALAKRPPKPTSAPTRDQRPRRQQPRYQPQQRSAHVVPERFSDPASHQVRPRRRHPARRTAIAGQLPKRARRQAQPFVRTEASRIGSQGTRQCQQRQQCRAGRDQDDPLSPRKQR